MSQNNEQTEILKEILKWIKVTSFNQVKDVLNSILDTDSKKMIYQLSDGKLTSTEIIKKAKASSASITKYWNQWPKLGLGESISAEGGKRFKRSFDLADFNLLPKLMKENTKERSED